MVDIDQDGQVDVLVGDRGSSEILAWRGSPSGWPLQPEVVGEVELGLESLELIDLDLDGDADLVAEIAGSRVVAHLNDGTGEFGPAILLLRVPAEATEAILSFDVADVTGDPRPDLVFSLAGSPTISDTSVFALTDLLGGAPVPVFLLDAASPVTGVLGDDFDGDGDGDVFLCTPDTAVWYRNDGTFIQLGSVAVLPSGVGFDANFASGDFDGDGIRDVVSHTIGTFRTRTYAHRGDGTGNFEPPVDLGYNNPNGRQFQLRDMDGDGDDDLIINGPPGLLTVESLPGGGFSSPINAPGGSLSIQSIDTVDTDGDGLPEVLYTTPLGAVRSRKADPTSADLILTDVILSITQTLIFVPEGAVADLNGDGNEDVIALEPPTGQVRWWPGDGEGGTSDWQPPIDAGTNPCDIEAFDTDGDGDIDLLIGSDFGNSLSIVENLGNGEFASPVQIPMSSSGGCELNVVDLDGDGRADVVRPQYSTDSILWARNLGNGLFAPEQLLFTSPHSWQDYTIADREGDGDLDVLIDATQGLVSLTVLDWYLNDGAANFTGPFQALSADNGLPAGFSQGINVADCNGDGLMDVLQSVGRKGPPSGSVLLLMTGTGIGTFGPPQTIDSSTSWSLWSPSLADVDADGIPDALVNSSALRWYRGRGDGTFEDPVTLLEPMGFFFSNWYLSADFDLDGDLDHIVAPGGGISQVETLALGELGTAFCDPASANSTGQPAGLGAVGSAQVASNAVTLEASALPPLVLTLFAVSRTSGPPMPIQNSAGELCLTGPIGRFTGPGQLQTSDGAGTATLPIDVGQLPLPGGAAAALAGEQWSFQAWYRDTVAGSPTSNFTSGVAVQFL